MMEHQGELQTAPKCVTNDRGAGAPAAGADTGGGGGGGGGDDMM